MRLIHQASNSENYLTSKEVALKGPARTAEEPRRNAVTIEANIVNRGERPKGSRKDQGMRTAIPLAAICYTSART